MIGIIDYGMGNLRSVQKALESLGYEANISSDIEELKTCKALILPGVGAFPDAMKNIRENKLDTILIDFAKENKPVLGICLGMQLLLDVGYEVEECKGLGLIEGSVEKIPDGVKIPHMGWNDLTLKGDCEILKGLKEGSYVYFVHSFYVNVANKEDLKASTFYGVEVPAVISKGNVFGAQFHPEKSGDIGMTILNNFGKLSV